MNEYKWGTVCGHWGDVLLSIQRFKNIIGEGNIVYLGPFDDVATFLKAQDFIHEVKHYKEPHFIDVVLPVFSNKHDTAPDWRKYFNQNGDIPEDDLIPTHIDPEIILWHDPSLIPEAVEWADEFCEQLPEVFFLIQPFSFASVSEKRHWQHWHAFIKELVEFSPFTFVMAGHNWPSGIKPLEHPRLINMVDKIPSVQHLYALSDKATGVITTSNSLAHWCAAKGTPMTVICNAACSNEHYYFRRALAAGLGHIDFVNSDGLCTHAVDLARSLFPYP